MSALVCFGLEKLMLDRLLLSFLMQNGREANEGQATEDQRAKESKRETNSGRFHWCTLQLHVSTSLQQLLGGPVTGSIICC
jgi:hypothetical protein